MLWKFVIYLTVFNKISDNIKKNIGLMNLEKLVIILITLLFISCATSRVISGGAGSEPKYFEYTYESQTLGINKSFSNLSFGIIVSKYDELNLVEPPLNYIHNCFQQEIESNEGTVLKASKADFVIKIVISKYITRKFNNKTYKTFIDLQFIIIDQILEKQIIEKTISISSTSYTAKKSNIQTIQMIINKILKNEKFINYLNNLSNNDSKITYFLNRISKAVVSDLTKQFHDDNIKLAFIGFKNDEDQIISNIFISSFIKFLNNTNFKIYTRKNLEDIYTEHRLAMSGFIDESLLELLKIEAVEYIITGNISWINTEKILEIQIINILNGEIVVSKSINIIL